jgi:WS/DGAT/MGAT family acyltransferase
MSESPYERLTALDASFVDIEDVNVHMHVAAALLFDPGPLADPEGGLDMEGIRSYVASRLQFIPRYRQRLAYIPFERHPVWVDDDRFNLFYHVRHSSLPRPGSERQLKRLCGRILSQKLDLTKPLWEIWVVEGLEGGRFALITKVHHCMVDGISGVDLLTVLLSPEPLAVVPVPEVWRPRTPPTAGQLVAGEVWRRAAMAADALRGARRVVADPLAALESMRGTWEGVAEILAAPPSSATPINPPHIGPHRRFDWLRLDLAEVKGVKERLGGTLNDVVLATVSGAMRRFLGGRGLSLEGSDFRAMIPVNVRRQSERGALGNRVAQMIAPLPLAETDPCRCLARVSVTTQELKRSHQVEATEFVEQVGDWTATAVLTQLVRLTAFRRPFNIVVTNVPGPPVPLYLLGARMLASFPMVPLYANQGLGIALFSYDDGLYWGISADWDAVPDVHDFVEFLGTSFDELRVAAARKRPRRAAPLGPSGKSAAPRKRTTPKRP